MLLPHHEQHWIFRQERGQWPYCNYETKDCPGINDPTSKNPLPIISIPFSLLHTLPYLVSIYQQQHGCWDLKADKGIVPGVTSLLMISKAWDVQTINGTEDSDDIGTEDIEDVEIFFSGPNHYTSADIVVLEEMPSTCSTSSNIISWYKKLLNPHWTLVLSRGVSLVVRVISWW